MYKTEVKVHPMNTLKKIREKLARAESLRGWPLPNNGYTFLRHQPLTEDHANNNSEELLEGSGKTLQKLGIKDGDAIEVVPSSFEMKITAMGMAAILVNIRSSDKVVTLRGVGKTPNSKSPGLF
ncbi:hypothetical protein ACLB2K_000397 [Fragaria x ananassa]